MKPIRAISASLSGPASARVSSRSRPARAMRPTRQDNIAASERIACWAIWALIVTAVGYQIWSWI